MPHLGCCSCSMPWTFHSITHAVLSAWEAPAALCPWGCYADSRMGQGRNLFAELCLCVCVCVHMHALYKSFSLQLWKKHLALCSGHHSFALLLECVIRAMKIYISNYKQEQAQLQGSISEYLLSAKNNLEAFLFVSVNI